MESLHLDHLDAGLGDLLSQWRRAIQDEAMKILGIPLIISPDATKTVERVVKRSWRERLFTMNRCRCGVVRWEPWRAENLREVQEPAAYLLSGSLLCHP